MCVEVARVILQSTHQLLKSVLCVLIKFQWTCGDMVAFQRSDCDYCGQWFAYEDRKLFCSPQCKHDYAGATNGAKRFNLTVEKKAAWEKKKFEEAV